MQAGGGGGWVPSPPAVGASGQGAGPTALPWAPGDTIPLPYKDPVVLASAARGGAGARYVRRALLWHGWDLAQTLLPGGP